MSKLEEFSDTVALEVKQYCMMHAISMKLDAVARYDLYAAVVRGLRNIAVTKLEDFTYTHPDGLLQYLKLAVLPKWLLKKYPVRYFTIHHSADALYEKIQLPEHLTGYHQRVTKSKRGGYTDE